MIVNTWARWLIEFSVAGMMILTLATALAIRPPASDAPVVERHLIDQPVVLNIKTRIYHCPACDLIKHCGSDCETVDLTDALRRGGRPCLTCGGTCLAKE